ncbi:MAG: antibiotic biosynthesis monooxygenase family protein [Candidatus Acidiferrales bacterium]
MATPSFSLTRPEVQMYARVWKLVILPGKIEEFTAAAKTGMEILQRQAGFHGLLVLRTGPGEGLEATVISVWDSIEALRNSETPAYQEALVHFLSLCERRPSMREEEVMVSEFASANLDDTVTKF